MTGAAGIRVSVVCAWPHRVWRRELTIPAGATVGDALAASAWRTGLADIADDLVVALHGQLVRLDRVLQEGDRLELCRPLRIDPREARRQQAAAGRTARR